MSDFVQGYRDLKQSIAVQGMGLHEVTNGSFSKHPAPLNFIEIECILLFPFT